MHRHRTELNNDVMNKYRQEDELNSPWVSLDVARCKLNPVTAKLTKPWTNLNK